MSSPKLLACWLSRTGVVALPATLPPLRMLGYPALSATPKSILRLVVRPLFATFKPPAFPTYTPKTPFSDAH